MENWELDFEWVRVKHIVKDALGRDSLPDFRTILFLIGIQELGLIQHTFSKEEKQDLMHVAVCRLLAYDHYYEFVGRDADGWPHYKSVKDVPVEGVKEQETFLKKYVIRYFRDLELENGGFEGHVKQEQ